MMQVNKDAAYAAKHDAAYAVNGQPATADAFYDIACDPRRSVAVEACAGAGKTWMLITRMVRALEAGAAADQVLAITFTKKAAGEMRERLQARLALPEYAALKLRLLEAGRSVQISTFHAWFAQLLKAAPLAVLQRLALPLQYGLLEDDSVLLPELELAFYALVASDSALRADFAALLMQLGRSKVSDALTGLLAKRVEFELCDQGGLLEASVDSAAQLYPAFAAILSSDACQANKDGALTDAAWLDARPEMRSQLGLLAKVLGQHHTDTIQGWARQLEMGLTGHDLSLVQAALLTQKLEPRKLGKMKLTDIPSELQNASTGAIGGHSGEALLLHCQAYLLEILAVQHQRDCWLYQQRMTRLGRAWLAAFAQLKRDRGLVDMSDLERAATTLLSDPELSGAVQERLDLKLRHVMIDEFQDTNPLQWQAMHAWLASYAGSGGAGHGGQSRPSLFIVGDPKQSIYRFRRAEPRVFAAAQVFMQDSFDAALLSCDHTRRNAPEVVAVVNAAMAEAMDESSPPNESRPATFRPHTTASDAFGAALCLPLIARALAPASSRAQVDGDTSWRDSLSVARIDAELTLREQEAEQAADWIAMHLKSAIAAQSSTHPVTAAAAAITHGVPSVIVLSRRHSSLALMQAALQQRGIASDKQEKTFLAHVPAVQDVLALLSALVSPQSDLDLARALKSPLFGWSDAQLMDLRTLQLQDVQSPSPTSLTSLTSSYESALPQTAVVPARPWMAYLPSELRAQLARWQTWLHHLPPHDALQAIYDDADVLRKYRLAMPLPIMHTSQMALQALLWAALQEGGGRYLNAYGFLRALRAKTQTIKAPATATATATAATAVQLLTIHGAKGLEADTVVLLDSDPQPIKAQSMTTLVDWQPEQPAPQRFVFLQSESHPPKCTEHLLQADQRARAVEEVNTLYVAMTRARSTLVVSACEAFHANPHSMWQRLNGLCEAVNMDAVVMAAPVIPVEPPFDRSLPAGLRLEAKDFDKLSPHGAALRNRALTLPEFPVKPNAQNPPNPEQTTFAEQASITEQGLAESAAIGRAVHRLLQWLPVAQSLEPQGLSRDVLHDWPLHELQAAGHEFQLTPAALSTAHGMAQAMANGEAAWLWDAQQIDWQANEYELVYQGRVLRIDRLVKRRDSQAWWVIDFKSASQPELSNVLVHQMTAYGRAVQSTLGKDVCVSDPASQHDTLSVQLAFVTGAGRLVML
jgi:ATP-dependent helicase/nuclease subunit A